MDSLLSLPSSKSKSGKARKVIFLCISWGERETHGRTRFCFLKTMWYYRGNVVYLPTKEKEEDDPRVFSAPGHAYGAPRAFPPPREGKAEIERLARPLLLLWPSK